MSDRHDAARRRAAVILDFDEFHQSTRHDQRSPMRPRTPTVPQSGRTGGGAKGGSRESVFRILNASKAAGAVVGQARYIARVSPHVAPEVDRNPETGVPDEVPLENDRRETVAGAEEINKELRGWDLVPDEFNRSGAYRKASAAERAAMPREKALKTQQTAHIIFSVPKGSANAQQLERAARRAMGKAFAGHRYVWTIHTDHGRPHVHALVKLTGEHWSPDNRPQRLDRSKAALAEFREIFTREAQAEGIDVIATNRLDRAKERGAILEGAEPVHKHEKMSERQARMTPRDRILREIDQLTDKIAAFEERGLKGQWASQKMDKLRKQLDALDTATGKQEAAAMADAQPGARDDLLRAKAPKWYNAHGLAYEAARAGVMPPAERRGFGALLRRDTPLAKQGQALSELVGRMRHYQNPEQAARSFLSMARENPRLASWAYHKRPEAFGLSNPDKHPGKMPWSQVRDALAAVKKLHDKPLSPDQQRMRDDLAADSARRDTARRAAGNRATVAKEYRKVADELAAGGSPADQATAEAVRAQAEAAEHGRSIDKRGATAARARAMQAHLSQIAGKGKGLGL